MKYNTSIANLNNEVNTEEIGPLGNKSIKLIPVAGNSNLQINKEVRSGILVWKNMLMAPQDFDFYT